MITELAVNLECRPTHTTSTSFVVILVYACVHLARCRRTPYPVPCLLLPCPSAITLTVPVGVTACTRVDTAVSIVFSNTVRAERSEDRHRMPPIGVLRHSLGLGGGPDHGLQPVAGRLPRRLELVGGCAVPHVCHPAEVLVQDRCSPCRHGTVQRYTLLAQIERRAQKGRGLGDRRVAAEVYGAMPIYSIHRIDRRVSAYP